MRICPTPMRRRRHADIATLPLFVGPKRCFGPLSDAKWCYVVPSWFLFPQALILIGTEVLGHLGHLDLPGENSTGKSDGKRWRKGSSAEKVPQFWVLMPDPTLWIIRFHPTSSHGSAERSRSKVGAKDHGCRELPWTLEDMPDMPVDEVRSWFDKNEVTCSGRGPQVDLKLTSRVIPGWGLLTTLPSTSSFFRIGGVN